MTTSCKQYYQQRNTSHGSISKHVHQVRKNIKRESFSRQINRAAYGKSTFNLAIVVDSSEQKSREKRARRRYLYSKIIAITGKFIATPLRTTGKHTKYYLATNYPYDKQHVHYVKQLLLTR